MATKRRARLGVVLLSLVFVLGACLIEATRKRSLSAESLHRFLPPPPSVEYLAGGYKDFVADVFWLRLIQDADHCDEPASRSEIIGTCKTEKGWVYLMLDAITRLAPKFGAAYEHGATILSVLIGDKEGARLIFERGITEFPQDWQLQYRAAYHALERRGDISTAASLLVRAGQNGAPAWVFALAAKLYTKEGQAILAKSVLEEILASAPDDARWASRLRQRLEEVDRALAETKKKP